MIMVTFFIFWLSKLYYTVCPQSNDTPLIAYIYKTSILTAMKHVLYETAVQ